MNPVMTAYCVVWEPMAPVGQAVEWANRNASNAPVATDLDG